MAARACVIWTALQLLLLYCSDVSSSSSGLEDVQATDVLDGALVAHVYKCQPWSVPPEQQCAYVLEHNATCIPEGGMDEYIKVHYCFFPPGWRWLSITCLVAFCLFLFGLLLTTAERFFCPALELISSYLKLSPAVAGATLLTFGNGAPDVFTQLAAVKQGPAHVGMALAEPIGGALFVSNVVFSLCVLMSSKTHKVDVLARNFLKDVLFLLLGICTMLAFMIDGTVHTWECALLISEYLLYVAVTLLLSRHDEPVHAQPAAHEVPLDQQIATLDDLSSDVEDDEEMGRTLDALWRVNGRDIKAAGADLHTPLLEHAGNGEHSGDGEHQHAHTHAHMHTLTHTAGQPQQNGVSSSSSVAALVTPPRLAHDQRVPEASALGTQQYLAQFIPLAYGAAGRDAVDPPTPVLQSPAPPPLAVSTEQQQGPTGITRSLSAPGDLSLLSSAGQLPSSSLSAVSRSRALTRNLTTSRVTLRAWQLPTDAALHSSRNGQVPLGQASRSSSTAQQTEFTCAACGSTAGLHELSEAGPETAEAARKTWKQRVEQPLVLLLSLTMPRVSMHRRIYRLGYVVMLPVTVPLFVAAAWGVMLRELSVHVLVYGALCGALSSVFIWALYPNDGRYHGRIAGVFTVMTFALSMVWLNVVSDQLVGTISVFGRIMSINPTVLGGTLLAWGNSLPDAVSNTALSRDGYPTMALTACFGSPLFALLAGASSSLTLAEILGGGDVKLEFDTPLMLSYAAALASLASAALLVPLVYRWQLGARQATQCLVFYVVYQVAYVVCVRMKW